MSEYSELLVARCDHFHEVVVTLAAFNRDNGKTFRKRNKLLGLIEIIYLLCFSNSPKVKEVSMSIILRLSP